MYTLLVMRARILAVIVTVLLLGLACILIHQTLDLHDMQAFGIEPELPLFLIGSLVLLCVGTVVLLERILASLSKGSSELSQWLQHPLPAKQGGLPIPEAALLLFSPPSEISSLRI